MSSPPILVAGSALWDIVARTERLMRPKHDVPGRISRQLGGVALNVALELVRQGARVELLSAVGTDAEGDALVASVTSAGVGCDHVARIDGATDSYLAIEDGSGDVFAAVADCMRLEDASDVVLAPLRDTRLGAASDPWGGVLIVDGNFPRTVLDTLATDPVFAACRLALVPASPGKAKRLTGAMRHPRSVLYLNRTEAEILCDAQFSSAALAAEALVGMAATEVVVTDGHRPAAVADAHSMRTVTPPQVNARTSTGAGDVFLAAHLNAREGGATQDDALTQALAAASRHITGHRIA
ncbi:MAG: PfkB family carbohydrate kinase [Pseudomonadota bacterium]